jgi:hypothetical protein
MRSIVATAPSLKPFDTYQVWLYKNDIIGGKPQEGSIFTPNLVNVSTVDGLRLVVTPGKFQFIYRESATELAKQKAKRMAFKISAVPNAVGLNFSAHIHFGEIPQSKTPLEMATEIIGKPDGGWFNSLFENQEGNAFGWNMRQKKEHYSLNLDTRLVKRKLREDRTEEFVNIEFNFHSETKSIEDVKKFIDRLDDVSSEVNEMMSKSKVEDEKDD